MVKSSDCKEFIKEYLTRFPNELPNLNQKIIKDILKPSNWSQKYKGKPGDEDGYIISKTVQVSNLISSRKSSLPIELFASERIFWLSPSKYGESVKVQILEDHAGKICFGGFILD